MVRSRPAPRLELLLLCRGYPPMLPSLKQLGRKAGLREVGISVKIRFS